MILNFKSITKKGLPILSVVLFICQLCTAPLHAQGQRKQPNILLFIGAEISAFDLAPYGNKTAETPYTEILARQGMLFERAYSPTALTTPALNAILTGKHPLESGIHHHGQVLQPAALSAFQASGYRIAITSPEGPHHLASTGLRFIPLTEVPAFMKEGGSQPFFLIVLAEEPRFPYSSINHRRGKVQLMPGEPSTPANDKHHSDHAAELTGMDRQLGWLMDSLGQADKAFETVFVMTALHGHGIRGRGTLYESAVRVPLIVRWPVMVKERIRSRELVCTTDILPTLAEAARLQQTQEGHSFLNLLHDRRYTPRTHILLTHTNSGQLSANAYPIRGIVNKEHKLLWNANYGETLRNQFTHGPRNDPEDADPIIKDWRRDKTFSSYISRPQWELYNLEQDLGEQRNLADNNRHASTLEQLKSTLSQELEQHGDEPLATEKQVGRR